MWRSSGTRWRILEGTHTHTHGRSSLIELDNFSNYVFRDNIWKRSLSLAKISRKSNSILDVLSYAESWANANGEQSHPEPLPRIPHSRRRDFNNTYLRLRKYEYKTNHEITKWKIIMNEQTGILSVSHHLDTSILRIVLTWAETSPCGLRHGKRLYLICYVESK